MHTLLLLILLMPFVAVAGPVDIFVSVAPLKTFVEKVGGNHVRVHTMVSPGHNPATYEPSPQQISKLTQTSLYFRVGVPFENAWMQRIASSNTNMQVIDLREQIPLRQLQSHHAEHHDHDSNELDPHIWTSPRQAIRMLTTIRDNLIDILPQYREEFNANQLAYSAELEQLDQDINARLKQLSGHKFMVFHPSWGYFADAYHLEQIAIEKLGKEPGARTLVQLINQARTEQVKVIFVQPQFSRQSAAQIARAIGGRVIAIDPLASEYIKNLQYITQQLAEAMQ